MKDLKKLSRAEMKDVFGGKEAVASCTADCGGGKSVSCGGTCGAKDGVGCYTYTSDGTLSITTCGGGGAS